MLKAKKKIAAVVLTAALVATAGLAVSHRSSAGGNFTHFAKGGNFQRFLTTQGPPAAGHFV